MPDKPDRPGDSHGSTGTHRNNSFAILIFQEKPTGDDLPYLSLDDIKGIANTCGYVLSSLAEKAVRRARKKDKLLRPEQLTKREHQVLQLIDCSDEDVGQALRILTETVRKHKEHIRTKLGAEDDTEARLIAYDKHLYFPLEGIISKPCGRDELALLAQH